MHFLKRHRFALLCLAVLLLANVLIWREFQARDLGHIRLREDFIALVATGHSQEAETDFQRLVAQMGQLSDRTLIEDFQRTQLLLDSKNPDTSSLIYKYQCALSLYLRKRSEDRLTLALDRARRD
jgi:cell division protein FtsL